MSVYSRVECNHFVQERKDIFGRRDVVESFRFHPSLVLALNKKLKKVSFVINCDDFILHSSLQCVITIYIFNALFYIAFPFIYHCVTHNSRCNVCAGVSVNIHSFIEYA